MDQNPLANDPTELPDNPTQDDHDHDLDDRPDTLYNPAQQPHLAEDGATPAAPPTDVPGAKIAPTSPALDSADDLQDEEVYDVGAGNASNVNTMVEDSDRIEKPVDENQDTTGRIR
jgi:hypothetical protein